MKTSLLLLTALFVPAFLLRAQENDKSASSDFRNRLRERLKVIAADKDSPFGSGKLAYLEEQVGRKLTQEEKEAFETTEAGRWRTFEDDLIKFEHPDHALFQVSVLDEKSREPIRVVGGVASMADNSFQRAYHLKVGDLYYGVIFVREADWFDEGICLCGPIAFKKCVLAEGTALEFSLLPSGTVKKVQALGGKHRAILFEWTHSVIPQSAYARLGASVRLKVASTKPLKEWVAFSKEKRGTMGLVSWMEPGDDQEKVLDLLGNPTRRKGDRLEYVSEEWRADGDGYQTTISVDLKEDKFQRFENGWSKWQELPPKPNTVVWAESRVQHWQSDKATDAEKKSTMPGELTRIADLAVSNARSAKEPDWGRWIGIARSIVELGSKDRRILDVVLARYAEADLGHFYSNDILEAFEHPGRQSMFESRAVYLLKQKEPDQGGELNNLLAMMDRESPVYEGLVRQACEHKSPDVRHTGYSFAERLSKTVGLSLLRKGLDDEDESARQMAALSIDEVVGPDDVTWLKERLSGEKDKRVKEALKDAIEAANKPK